MRITRIFRPSGIAVLLGALACLTACTDDSGALSPGRSIRFDVDAAPSGGWAPAATRGGAPAARPVVEVTPVEGEAPGSDSLYLHAVTTEGIARAGETPAPERGGQEEAVTRAAPVTTATMYPNATVFAAAYPASSTWDGSAAPGYFFDTEIRQDNGWSTDSFWPGASNRLAFFAYAPHHCPGVTLTTGITTPGAPVFSYTVPATVASQADLLTASSVDVPGVRLAPEPLLFKHALTAVRFETGTPLLPGTVTKITLKGVYGTGTHRIGETAWSAHSGQRDYSQTLTAVTPDPNVLGAPITQSAQTFMMIPQTLPAGASLEVVYTDKLTNTQRTLTASIAGKTWPMGKTVTYRISTNSIVVTPILAVTPPADFEYTGGSNNYTVTSYLQVTRPGDPTKTVPAPWTVEYSTDNGGSWSTTKPAWLAAFTGNGVGNVSPVSLSAVVQAQGYFNPHTAALQAAPQKTNWNLSNAVNGGDAVVNTANCYVVNAPGTYRLPLVYGNAIKGGVTNSSAYTSAANGTNVLKTFINHRGAAITNPYIFYNAYCTPAYCRLVWQDEQNLVTNVGLSGNFLTFTVNQATIKQGNAVVAVCNAANTVLWSWHIWVTDYVLGTNLKAITNFQYKQYTILPVNLGWCDGEEKYYAERTVKVRFRQPGTSATPKIITVKQKAHFIAAFGNNTYFQWGRKDPFVGGLWGNINKTWYNAAGTASTGNPPIQSFANGTACITSCITNPNTFCTNEQMEYTYSNLWSANNTVYTVNDNPVVKTIYDPSPVGYKLPPSNAFTGFTTTGQHATTLSQFNVSGAWSNGWNFHCGLYHTGTTVFFPASGWRDYFSAAPSFVSLYSVFWSAVSFSAAAGWNLAIGSSAVNPMSAGSRGGGFVVRPCLE